MTVPVRAALWARCDARALAFRAGCRLSESGLASEFSSSLIIGCPAAYPKDSDWLNQTSRIADVTVLPIHP